MKKVASYLVTLVCQPALILKGSLQELLLFKISKFQVSEYEISVPVINQTHSIEYRLEWVANATVGPPIAPNANTLRKSVAPSVDLFSTSLGRHGTTPGEGPRAEGARRVLNGSKLCSAS